MAGVTKGEELFVDLDELLLVELTRGAVLDEAFVPLLQLFLVDYRVRHTFLGSILSQRTLFL